MRGLSGSCILPPGTRRASHPACSALRACVRDNAPYTHRWYTVPVRDRSVCHDTTVVPYRTVPQYRVMYQQPGRDPCTHLSIAYRSVCCIEACHVWRGLCLTVCVSRCVRWCADCEKALLHPSHWHLNLCTGITASQSPAQLCTSLDRQ